MDKNHFLKCKLYIFLQHQDYEITTKDNPSSSEVFFFYWNDLQKQNAALLYLVIKSKILPNIFPSISKYFQSCYNDQLLPLTIHVNTIHFMI